MSRDLSRQGDPHREPFAGRSYEELWSRQRELQRQLIDGSGVETVLYGEHEPVITLGKSASPESLRLSREALQTRGIAVLDIERGGDATYHGPGQLVVYPILNLNNYRRDVAWYMRLLEESVITTLASYSITGDRIPGKTGVWITPPRAAPRKIAALGVRISRWCTMHGVSLNVADCREGFATIFPCGFRDAAVTSIEQELTVVPPISEVADRLLEALGRLVAVTRQENVPREERLTEIPPPSSHR